MPSVIVAGALANKPGNGGAAWTRLSWALGFKSLGFEVFFVEQIARDACVDARGQRVDPQASINFAFFRGVTEAFGLGTSAALVLADTGRVVGGSDADAHDIQRRAARADALINISGNLARPALRSACRRTVFVDLDPGYTQTWHAEGRLSGLEGHDFYFTVGENIGRGAGIVDDGLPWRPVRQPVLLDQWPACPDPGAGAFTTIASWRGPFGRVSHDGVTFGVKAHEFRRFVELPGRTRQRFEIALDIHPADEADRRNLEDHGWTIVDPATTAASPAAFRRYVQQSRAEFSVAQGIYVETNSGWFSDRTTRYLASGRPALVQDTGFSRNHPVGEGLLAFRTLEDAMNGVEAIQRDYARHARAARALAVERFDARTVLSGLAATIGIGP